jgi:hypothetical protein
MFWKKRRIELLVPAFLILTPLFLFVFGNFFDVTVEEVAMETDRETTESTPFVEKNKKKAEDDLEATFEHVELPEEVRGIYWTAVTARSSWGQSLLQSMKETGLNTVVIDVKMDNGQLVALSEFRDILDQLYEEGIYRIARVAVMRDGVFGREHPHVALRSPSGGFWYDNIGSIWVDPASDEVAEYAIELGEALYALGFDEIQYDYVRFASDGAISSIVYPVYDSAETKVAVMQRFFQRVGGTLQAQEIPVSFDVFGMTFWSLHDYNIGQRLVDVFPYTDWVSPMVYPSHYANGFRGHANPALYPYDVVKSTLDAGTNIMLGVYGGSENTLRSHWRPWLQDFDIGAIYTQEMILAQIQATRDAGASGWMLWNARNVYEWTDYR